MPARHRALTWAAIVFVVVLGSSLFGIFTRPVGFLAAFWPANAALLGLFVRFPGAVSVPGWLAAVAGYLVADLLTGGDMVLTTWLTAANLAGVAVGVCLFSCLSEEDRRLRRPLSVLYLFGILVASATSSAIVGAGAAPVYFDKDIVSGAAFWFTTELANGIVLLPAILTAQPFSLALRSARRAQDRPRMLRRAVPAVALGVSVLVGGLVGGPGAVAFPVPALLWCALTYSVFPTVVLTLLVSVWNLMAVSLGFFSPQVAHLDSATMSGRLGIMLLALGPLTVASINAARNDLLKRLENLVTYDTLTGALSRAAFLQRGASVLSDPVGTLPCAVLMLDIDRFKTINDTYGHAAGDAVLRDFARIAGQSLREGDLLGRIGGEEFAAMLPRTSGEEAMGVAERVRRAVETLRIPVTGSTPLSVTVSIGIAQQPNSGAAVLDTLLKIADRALYDAKATGRNRTVSAESTGHGPVSTPGAGP